MYKFPESIKKNIYKLKRNDSKIWSKEDIKKENVKFTKEAKLIRNLFFKERHERIMEMLLNPKKINPEKLEKIRKQKRRKIRKTNNRKERD